MPNKPNQLATLRAIQYGIVEPRIQKVDAPKCTLSEWTDKQSDWNDFLLQWALPFPKLMTKKEGEGSSFVSILLHSREIWLIPYHSFLVFYLGLLMQG